MVFISNIFCCCFFFLLLFTTEQKIILKFVGGADWLGVFSFRFSFTGFWLHFCHDDPNHVFLGNGMVPMVTTNERISSKINIVSLEEERRKKQTHTRWESSSATAEAAIGLLSNVHKHLELAEFMFIICISGYIWRYSFLFIDTNSYLFCICLKRPTFPFVLRRERERKNNWLLLLMMMTRIFVRQYLRVQSLVLVKQKYTTFFFFSVTKCVKQTKRTEW